MKSEDLVFLITFLKHVSRQRLMSGYKSRDHMLDWEMSFKYACFSWCLYA